MDHPISPSASDPTPRLALRLWREALSPYKGRLAISFGFMVALAGAEFAFILATQWIFAGLSPTEESRFTANAADVVVWGPVLILVLGLFQAAVFYGQVVTSQGIGISLMRDVQQKMYDRILTLDLAQTEGDGAGPLVSRFTNDMAVLRTSLVRAPNGVRDGVRLIGIVVALVVLDPILFLAVLLIYPVVGLPVTWLGKRIRHLGRHVQRQIGELTGVLTESVQGRRMITSYRLEDYERRRLGEAFEERHRLLHRLLRINAANEPVITVIGAVAIAAIIGIAAFRIDAGLMSGADLVAFLVAMALLSAPARGLGTLNAALQEGFSALERMFDVLDRRPTITDRPGARSLSLPAGPPDIRFEGVHFAYREGEPILRGIDLTVPAGATVALVGPSGAGKSSLFGLIPRLYEAESGRILIAGQAIDSVTLASIRDAIALVSQDAVLFDDTVGANIRFGRADADDEALKAAAVAAAAHDFIEALPQGYQTPVGERGEKLSGGQRQRVALARAFLKDAPILLLDEATAALDAESERLIDEALKRLAAGRTTLVIAHRLSTVCDADLICVMDRGQIVETGTHAELVAKGGLYARLAALQFGEAT
ncbi:ABC transporter ATP-binding protein [Parvularcula bermudensis HTCC2503]|uniref:ABC transporter ATP-binding protein n=1 Tax=Parvularcula bermudensis (strain ATCC BAA-594 / HTCC2503 / KCTC 12087) TaxID=314260 RepID=E0TGQ6_PARBH|nr:ABC transporter ATP-binding protein [Parvularcula bermudensis]ADM10665.1 ABC transporter ATP-binding protein [Parvularcula bermudensis HTCC2503]